MVRGKQTKGLAAGYPPHAIHHETDGPQASHLQGLFAETVEGAVAAHPGSQWREAAHADAALAILHAIQRRIQQALIGGELLQCSCRLARSRSPRPEDRLRAYLWSP